MTLTEPLNTKRIFVFFYPLALSWLCMGLEGPISVSAISRMPHATINTAALQVLMAIALLIESPVIDLLSTSTALAANRQSFRLMRQFVIGLGIALTIVHLALVFTPAFSWLVVRVLGIPQEVATAAQSGLIWMPLWSAAIGWRRFNQGLLIRNGLTRWVGLGTLVRLASLISSVLLLPNAASLSGIEVIGIALVISVSVEAGFSHWAVQRVIKKLEHEPEPNANTLTFGQLCRFHFPLSATTLVMLGSQPAISFALARSPDSVLSLAGYQVALTFSWLIRASVYALPEVVITLGRMPSALARLKKFCLGAGAFASIIMVLVAISGVAQATFLGWMRAEPEVAALAVIALLWTTALPFIGAWQAYCRGVLTIHHNTSARLVAMLGGVAVLATSLAIGLATGIQGVINANLAQTIAHLFELGLLHYLMVRTLRKASALTAQAH